MNEREVGRVVRATAESVYGVTAVVGPSWLERLAARVGIGGGGVAVDAGPPFTVRLDLDVASGVPVGQVAANVAEKVRYVVQRDLGQPIDRLVVRVDGREVAVK